MKSNHFGDLLTFLVKHFVYDLKNKKQNSTSILRLANLGTYMLSYCSVNAQMVHLSIVECGILDAQFLLFWLAQGYGPSAL